MYLLLGSLVLSGCSVSRPHFSPEKKYAPEKLQQDFRIYRSLLEAHHPGLYWYQTEDSVQYFFNRAESMLGDSMTESQFRQLLNYTTAQINCGHTTVRSSKAWSKYADTVRLGKMFPISVKTWNDTVEVTANLNRRDSILVRGALITSINQRPIHVILDSLFRYISADGYNLTHKYQTLSNRGYFGSLYTSVYGLSDQYEIGYVDVRGNHGTTMIKPFNPGPDTFRRSTGGVIRPATTPPTAREKKLARMNAARLLKIDTANHSAMMDLSTFAKGYGLRGFFKNSFAALKNNGITHLIIDVRGNGGGSVTNSTLISRFIADHPFKISDSLYAIRKGSRYGRYIKNHFWNQLFIAFFTKKRRDGLYHFGYFERHAFQPKKHNHYDGKVYLLTGGNSFSATTLFASAIKGQSNVLIVGEETGGGAYGNTAWLIPDVTLPETGLRFRLPLFRLVMDKNRPKDGRGVQPDIESLPTVEAVKKGQDYKLDKVLELIKKDKESH